MTEKGFKSENEEGILDPLILEFWFPQWQVFKILNYIDIFKNLDSFCKNILHVELSDDLKSKDQRDAIKDHLIIEIIVSTMFLAEALAAIANAVSTNPKNIQKYFKEFDATYFYSEINKVDDEYYARILSLQHFVAEAKDYKEYFNVIRKYYFDHLDLFNSYKHGFRVFCPRPEDDKGHNIIYFSRRHKSNEVTFTRWDRSLDTLYKHYEIARNIAMFIQAILLNLKNWRQEEENKTKDCADKNMCRAKFIPI